MPELRTVGYLLTIIGILVVITMLTGCGTMKQVCYDVLQSLERCA